MLPNDTSCTRVMITLTTGVILEGTVEEAEGMWMAVEQVDGRRVLVNVVHIMTMVAL